jgi:hypothetical protein
MPTILRLPPLQVPADLPWWFEHRSPPRTPWETWRVRPNHRIHCDGETVVFAAHEPTDLPFIEALEIT